MDSYIEEDSKSPHHTILSSIHLYIFCYINIYKYTKDRVGIRSDISASVYVEHVLVAFLVSLVHSLLLSIASTWKREIGRGNEEKGG